MQATNIFFENAYPFGWAANMRLAVVATARGELNFVSFCTNTMGILCTVKFVFANCTPDFSVKNYVCINGGLSHVRIRLIYYATRAPCARAVQCIHGMVVCTGHYLSRAAASYSLGLCYLACSVPLCKYSICTTLNHISSLSWKILLRVEFCVIILLHEWVDRGQMHQL